MKSKSRRNKASRKSARSAEKAAEFQSIKKSFIEEIGKRLADILIDWICVSMIMSSSPYSAPGVPDNLYENVPSYQSDMLT